MSKKWPQITFNIYQGEQLVRSEKFVQDVIKIGKLSSSHLRIDDEKVSRMHAVVEATDLENISIIDLGSTRGTLVNGEKITKIR
jgi:pSer/pThr/pTyr-binding forkhead associated (FHA) protein